MKYQVRIRVSSLFIELIKGSSSDIFKRWKGHTLWLFVIIRDTLWYYVLMKGQLNVVNKNDNKIKFILESYLTVPSSFTASPYSTLIVATP